MVPSGVASLGSGCRKQAGGILLCQPECVRSMQAVRPVPASAETNLPVAWPATEQTPDVALPAHATAQDDAAPQQEEAPSAAQGANKIAEGAVEVAAAAGRATVEAAKAVAASTGGRGRLDSGPGGHAVVL